MTGSGFILASASPRRRDLLAQIGLTPSQTLAADIDETVRRGEVARDYVARLAIEKASAISEQHPKSLVLGADTAVAVGRRILPKTENEDEARACLDLLSGRAHRVYSGVAVARAGVVSSRCVETRVKLRRLSNQDVDEYIACGEWRGVAGGYAIQGLFAKHIVNLIGSYTNVVGLPLYQTANLLNGSMSSANEPDGG